MGVDYSGIHSDSGPIETDIVDPTGDYRWMQGAFPDELAAMLASPEARRQWVAARRGRGQHAAASSSGKAPSSGNRRWGRRYRFRSDHCHPPYRHHRGGTVLKTQTTSTNPG